MAGNRMAAIDDAQGGLLGAAAFLGEAAAPGKGATGLRSGLGLESRWRLAHSSPVFHADMRNGIN